MILLQRKINNRHLLLKYIIPRKYDQAYLGINTIFDGVQGFLIPNYVLELCHEKLKCNESAIYIPKG